jgi:hypothetical protein
VTSAEQDRGHGLAGARRHREEQRHADQDRTLLAMQQLEAALGSAAPHREEAWFTEVRRTLGVLSEAARDEADNAAQPDSLQSDIAPSPGCVIGSAACASTMARSATR